ncbi:LPXTG cell wall anchor domain-containing protein [Corynebacterium coyleae]|uniref:LPXTG cell wall anchor domain-containing protein n=1 Tax=Corynebacterium coyleae TaxID=53374 RepID=A0AAP6XLM6_9CORY|nr:LPXTG cell wall anchor domain-containing protein [Corynebacterium coyleae]NJJ04464.1 LPXTG cell wall anchor domain-containing protein [Corynebacterium coyleae]
MRNIMKPAATASSRTRRSVRGVAAVVASLALAAGLGSYPVDAQETSVTATTAESAVASENVEASEIASAETAVSETDVAETVAPAAQTTGPVSATQPSVAEKAPVQTTRFGAVDTITIDDPTGEAWQFGGKASPEDIFGIKRIGDGEIEEILTLTADGKNLDPESYGFTNNAEGGYIAFDMNALDVVPPKHIEVKVRATNDATYTIAESDEVPTARALAATGYGQNPQAARAATLANDGQARAANDTKWSEEVRLNSEIVGTGRQKFENIGTEPYLEVRPTGEHPDQVGRDIRITRVVVRNIEDNTRKPNNRAMIVKNDAADEQFYFKDATELKNEKNRIKGFEAAFFNPETGESPVAQQLIIYSGQDSIKVGIDGVPAWVDNLDTLRQRYAVEVYGSFRIPTEPTPPETSPTEEPEPEPESVVQGETTIGNATFRVVSETDPKNPMTLSEVNTTGANPYQTTAKFDQRSNFSGAVVQVKAPNSVLAVEQYGFHIDMLESGVDLDRRVISATKDSVVFEVFPVKDGKRIDSALVEKGATLAATTRFTDQPNNIDATITVKGTQVPRKVTEPTPLPRPTDENWLVKRLPNPELAKKCGLKVAIVADLSTSLKYADTNGFQASRTAASAMVDALAGTPTEVGIYHFSRTAGTDTEAVSVQDPQGVQTVKNAIAKWRDPTEKDKSEGATNWEAGLKAVQNQNYDVVYFITDGMPTWDDTGWQKAGEDGTGAYVQEKSLNQAIIAANALKSDGTRIVPLMVDLTLKAGNTVTRDYVLRNALPNGATGSLDPGRVRFQRIGARNPGDYPRATYKYPGNEIIVNIEEAQKKEAKREGYWHFFKGEDITKDPNAWSHGLREVKQMGEDISGDGDTIRVEGYSKLTEQLKSLATGLKNDCEGTFTVQKRIVNADGSVENAQAKDWSFTVNAGNENVLDTGDGTLKSNSVGITGDDGKVRWRTVNEDHATFSVVETQKDPYRIFQRDGANAVCSIRETEDSKTSFNLPISSNKENGINVDIPGYSHVTCVFDNYEPKDEFVKLELEKLDATDKSVLSNAKFEVRSDREGDGPFAVAWDEASQTYKTEAKLAVSKPYYLVETQAPTKNSQSYSLLVAPVEFQIVAGEDGSVVQIRDGENWTSEVVGAGLWTERPDKFDAATGYLQVANVRQGDLPKTGGVGLQLPILFGGALIAAGVLVGRRKVAV